MRVLIVENYNGTPAGQVGKALAEAGAAVDLRRAHLGEPLPADPDGYDGIVILGGEQNALADDACPWFPDLLALIRGFGESDRAVLGICLGAQLVARAWGGDQYPRAGRSSSAGARSARPKPVATTRSSPASVPAARSSTGTRTPSPFRPARRTSPRAT